MSLWTFKENVDEFFWFGLFNLTRRFHSRFLRTASLTLLPVSSEDWCLILNGPSSAHIEPQHLDYSKIVFVNFGFRRPEFSKVDQPILVIVDVNLVNGIWPKDMLEQAISYNPNCTFVLNYKFFSYVNTLSKEVQDKVTYLANSKIPTSYNIAKHNKTASFGFGVGVAEQSISLCIQNGAKNIHIYGLDCNNVVLALSNKNTHVYGSDEAKRWGNAKHNARELRFQSYMLDRLRLLKIYCDCNGICLYNYSDSLMTSFMDKK